MLFHTYRRELLSEESGPQWIHVPREETLDDKRCFFDRLRGLHQLLHDVTAIVRPAKLVAEFAEEQKCRVARTPDRFPGFVCLHVHERHIGTLGYLARSIAR